MGEVKGANIGARLDRLPNSSWHVKMWLIVAFALLVCWSNGIAGSVQNILLNEIHWLQPGTTLLAMWGTTYTLGQLFGALIGGPIGDKIGRKKSILLYETIHIIVMIGAAVSPNIYILYVFRFLQGLGLGALLVVLFAAFTEYVPGRNRGVWSSRNSFIGNWAHPICNLIGFILIVMAIPSDLNWRIQFMIPSILSIIATILIAKNFPESPRWLELRVALRKLMPFLLRSRRALRLPLASHCPLSPKLLSPSRIFRILLCSMASCFVVPSLVRSFLSV